MLPNNLYVLLTKMSIQALGETTCYKNVLQISKTLGVHLFGIYLLP